MLEIQTIHDRDHMLATLAQAAAWVESEEEFKFWSGLDYQFGEPIERFHPGQPLEVYLAWVDGRAVGYAELHGTRFEKLLARVLCHPEYRGHSVGRRLTEHACSRAFVEGAILKLFCYTENTHAHRLYLNLGFSEDEIQYPELLTRMSKLNPIIGPRNFHENSWEKSNAHYELK